MSGLDMFNRSSVRVLIGSSVIAGSLLAMPSQALESDRATASPPTAEQTLPTAENSSQAELQSDRLTEPDTSEDLPQITSVARNTQQGEAEIYPTKMPAIEMLSLALLELPLLFSRNLCGSIDNMSLDIQPVSGRIGAEIVGIDLSADLSDAVIREIRQAVISYRVIFFRHQNLDETGHVAFARRFGELTTAHPTVSGYIPAHPEIFDLDYSRQTAYTDRWHTDVTFIDRPPLGSILRAVTIPPYGGDTVWANTVAAYEDLPAHLKALAGELWVVHSNDTGYAAPTVDVSESTREYAKAFQSTIYQTIHPAVRVHPESGERSLLLGEFARSIKGLSAADSFDTLKLLQSYVTRLENTVRWRWQAGDIAFWDNRSTQHYAIADYGDKPRRVQRITIAGDVPVSIDGKSGKAVKGDSSGYTPRPDGVTITVEI